MHAHGGVAQPLSEYHHSWGAHSFAKTRKDGAPTSLVTARIKGWAVRFVFQILEMALQVNAMALA